MGGRAKQCTTIAAGPNMDRFQVAELCIEAAGKVSYQWISPDGEKFEFL